MSSCEIGDERDIEKEIATVMEDKSDWRLQGQDRYLKGVTLIHRRYRRYFKDSNWDHDHCEFCRAKFMEEDYPKVLHIGYATTDEYHWVCEARLPSGFPLSRE
jgi:hypothetical protein